VAAGWATWCALAGGGGISALGQDASRPTGSQAASEPAAEEVEEGIESPQAMFALLGIGPEIWERLRAGPGQTEETDPWQVLYSLRRFRAGDLSRWTIVDWESQEELNNLEKTQGDLLRVEGTLEEIAAIELPAGLAARFEMPRVYRCRIAREGNGERVTLLVREVPRAWKMGDLSEQVSAVGVLLGPSGEGGPDDAGGVLLAASRLAWHPDTPLGRLGMDVGLLDEVAQRVPMKERERDAFYQMLDAVGSFEEPEQARAPDSVVPLFNDPGGQVGRLVELVGIARRAIRVPVPDEEVRQRLGIDYYFEVELFTPDSQGNPLVCCLRELPEGMPEGDRIAENVWLWAFFLKVWSFETRGEVMKDERAAPRQLAPLLVGRTLHWRRDPLANPSSLTGWIGMAALVGVLAAVGLASWRLTRSDRRERAKIAQIEATTVDWERVEREEEGNGDGSREGVE